MGAEKQAAERKISQQEEREEVKSEKKFKAITETITQLLTSRETLFKTPNQMKCILKKEITKKLKESGIKKGLLTEEMDFLKQWTTAIVKRDQLIFNKYCHLARNELVNIGGFAKRLNKAAKTVNRDIKKLQKILAALAEASHQEINKDAAVILKEARKFGKEVQRAEKRLPHL